MSMRLAATAEGLACDERTLRRYVGTGLLRGERLSRGEVRLPRSEELYLRGNWEVLSRLKQALRTEPSVRLAVLFGSTATGDAGPDSDVDLMIDHRTGDPVELVRLQRRLGERLGKAVHVVLLQDVEQSPALLADILVEGRVIVDRDRGWKRLSRRRTRVLRDAAVEVEKTRGLAWQGVAEARARMDPG